jgi:uncharacterized protein
MPDLISAAAAVVAELDPRYAALALCLVAFASMVQASLGMGFGLAAAPLLAIIDRSLVPAVPLLLATIVAIISALKVRGSIHLHEFRLATVGRLAGTVLAAVGLSYILNPEIFSIIFAICIFVAVLLNAFSLEMKFNSRNLFAMGAASGLMATISSVGAPPMALLYKNRPPLPARATLSAFFRSRRTSLSIWALDIWLACYAGDRLVAPSSSERFSRHMGRDTTSTLCG